MARARLYCIFVLLLYSKSSYGQQALGNNQNSGMNNALDIQQQQNLQRPQTNFNQIPNGGINVNSAQQSNSQQANSQLSATVFGANQGNLQPQTSTGLQNNFQITKLGFIPVTPGLCPMQQFSNQASSQQLQNSGVKANIQINTRPQASTLLNSSPVDISTLAEFAALKGQSPLLSLLNPQNNDQYQNNPLIVLNSQNQLSDAQKQFLVRSLQGQNQQGINMMHAPPNVVNMNNQGAITVRTVSQPPSQAIVTPLGNQPAFITVQAQPLTTYLQNQSPQVVVEKEPSILSLILSELGPQYAIDSDYIAPKKGSKTNLKSLIPLIISLLKEKNNCGCRNCGCPNNCQDNGVSSTFESESSMAEILEGYSNLKNYNQDSDNNVARIKKNNDAEFRNYNNQRKDDKKKTVGIDSAEVSEEDNSEYRDEDE